DIVVDRVQASPTTAICVGASKLDTVLGGQQDIVGDDRIAGSGEDFNIRERHVGHDVVVYFHGQRGCPRSTRVDAVRLKASGRGKDTEACHNVADHLGIGHAVVVLVVQLDSSGLRAAC